MSPVLDVLLCALIGSLLVSSCFLASLIVTARDYFSEKTRQLRREKNSCVDFSTEDFALICRSLSDSMNYKSEDRYKEKWDLLLKCKNYQLGSEVDSQDYKR